MLRTISTKAERCQIALCCAAQCLEWLVKKKSEGDVLV